MGLDVRLWRAPDNKVTPLRIGDGQDEQRRIDDLEIGKEGCAAEAIAEVLPGEPDSEQFRLALRTWTDEPGCRLAGTRSRETADRRAS